LRQWGGSGLVERRRNRGERGVELRADALHSSNDGERHTSGNESILDGGCAIFPSLKSGLAALSGCPAGLITQLTSDWQNFI